MKANEALKILNGGEASREIDKIYKLIEESAGKNLSSIDITVTENCLRGIMKQLLNDGYYVHCLNAKDKILISWVV